MGERFLAEISLSQNVRSEMSFRHLIACTARPVKSPNGLQARLPSWGNSPDSGDHQP